MNTNIFWCSDLLQGSVGALATGLWAGAVVWLIKIHGQLMELWLQGLQSVPASLQYRHILPFSNAGELQCDTTGERADALTEQPLNISSSEDKRYGCELPEGEDEPESSFSSVCKDTCRRQEEQSLTQFSFALGDISIQGLMSSSLHLHTRHDWAFKVFSATS